MRHRARLFITPRPDDVPGGASTIHLAKYAKAFGPGHITGTSDDSPSGIESYAHAGSQHGLSFHWAALLTFALTAAVQDSVP